MQVSGYVLLSLTAVAEACVSCHNHHKDTPERDFKLDDVMGGVVLRIAREPEDRLIRLALKVGST